MSRTQTVVTITCDGPGLCSAEYGPFGLEWESRAESNARDAGWWIEGDVALCPSCFSGGGVR